MIGRLDLGITGAKRGSTDRLMTMMRSVIKDNPHADEEAAINICARRIDEHEDREELIRLCIRRSLYNVYRSCITPKTVRRTSAEKKSSEDFIGSIIAKDAIYIWWNFEMPDHINGNHKKLCDSTFQEVEDAARTIGKGLSRLSGEGALGALVREVFKTPEELQEFMTRTKK